MRSISGFACNLVAGMGLFGLAGFSVSRGDPIELAYILLIFGSVCFIAAAAASLPKGY